MTLYPLLLNAWLSVSVALVSVSSFSACQIKLANCFGTGGPFVLRVWDRYFWGRCVLFVCEHAGLQPGANGLVPAETVQCIRPMPSWTGRCDVRPKRYDRVASTMFKRQPEADDRWAVKPDDSITVHGEVFPVHRVMLAQVSPIFDTAFQCGLEEGAQHCSPCASPGRSVSISK